MGKKAPGRLYEEVSGAQTIGDSIRGTLGDLDPLNKVPVQESQKRVKKGSPFEGPPYPT